MKTSDPKIPIIVIVGPTAVGKTTLSIELAKTLDGEIISADSRYYYRGMDIGTAKPTREEQAGIPHHLIDQADPDQTWSLTEFKKQSEALISDIYDRGKTAILVGGTGQYIRAITEGWTPPTIQPNEKLRAILEKMAKEIGSDGLHEKLAILDPIAAGNIDHRNLRRTIRALEVILFSGHRFSDLRSTQSTKFRPIIIGLIRPREELYARVDQRIDQMFADGFVDEVKTLLKNGYAKELPAMSAIGYPEVIAYLDQEISFDDCVTLIKRKTRMYVRRQANWFKPDDPKIHWFGFDEPPLVKILDLINEQLKK